MHKKYMLALQKVLMVISGVVMIFGVKKENRKMLFAGKVLSYVYPIGYWILVYPIAVHFLCIIMMNRYVEKEFEDDS
ncbi:uncharacterized protein LOC119546809 isoform X2 [Drosophila subpulchrella]|uniref:uncharacterized protein LOC119546809 isoform X2 n=1 Tax=Drosophila subpulchrella TaxID=1486046 RepID=UPI0018A16900|nr:uncharacterized protein LOC119546809 isoform X2 [Drosophila subpulchrella]